MSSIATELIRAALDLAEYTDELAHITDHTPPKKEYVTKEEYEAEFVKAAMDGTDLDAVMLQKLIKLSEVLDSD